MSNDEEYKSCPIEGEHRRALVEAIKVPGFSDTRKIRGGGGAPRVPIKFRGERKIAPKITQYKELIDTQGTIKSVIDAIDKVYDSFPDDFLDYCKIMVKKLSDLPESLETVTLLIIYKAYINDRDIKKIVPDEDEEYSYSCNYNYYSWYMKYFYQGKATMQLPYENESRPDFTAPVFEFLELFLQDPKEIIVNDDGKIVGNDGSGTNNLSKLKHESDLLYQFKYCLKSYFRHKSKKCKIKAIEEFKEKLHEKFLVFMQKNKPDKFTEGLLYGYCEDIESMLSEIINPGGLYDIIKPYKSFAIFRALVPLYQKMCEDLGLKELTKGNIEDALGKIPPLDEGAMAEKARVESENQAIQRASDLADKIKESNLPLHKLEEIIGLLDEIQSDVVKCNSDQGNFGSLLGVDPGDSSGDIN